MGANGDIAISSYLLTEDEKDTLAKGEWISVTFEFDISKEMDISSIAIDLELYKKGRTDRFDEDKSEIFGISNFRIFTKKDNCP